MTKFESLVGGPLIIVKAAGCDWGIFFALSESQVFFVMVVVFWFAGFC